jgi:hypothetical protein
MAAMLWIMLPLFVAAGSALLAFYIMQARMEVAVSKEREIIAEAQATIKSQERVLEEKVKATEEAALRRAFDQFLGDFRVEERHYMREHKSMFLNKKAMVLQERLFFRNIPLSNWVEHEMIVEEGSDLKSLARDSSIFSTRSLSSDEVRQSARLLQSGKQARTA